VVLCAAYLYNIGIKNALKIHHSEDRKYIAQESSKVAGEIMEKLGAKPELTDEITKMVSACEKPVETDSIDKKVLHDADKLAYMAACEKKQKVDNEEFSAKLDKIFLTPAGSELARQVLMETK
jgi:nitrate reductase beta subunit